MMVPVLPAAIWLLAAAFLILLMLVVFGYHLYQRSRMGALASEAANLAQLAAQKDRLTAEVAELQATLTLREDKLQKIDADRRSQELLRAEIAALERDLDNRRKESANNLKYAADLDVLVVKKRNLLSRLEAEVKNLEERKAELAPLEQTVLKLRAELEEGKIKVSLLGEKELEVESLQRQAFLLERDLEELQNNLGPLRQEKERLRLFIEQARHASSVKNERILEQNELIRSLEISNSEQKRQAEELTTQIAKLHDEYSGAEKQLEQLKLKETDTRAGMEELSGSFEKRLASLTEETKECQAKIVRLNERRAELETEVESLTARKAVLELELERHSSTPERRRVAKKNARRPVLPHSSITPGKRMAPRKSELVYCSAKSGI